MRMQEEHRNMYDVRSAQKVKSLRLKMEKRALERLGYAMIMKDNRITKRITLG